jgi:hypothetical protein
VIWALLLVADICRFTIIEAPDEATYARALDINDRGDTVGDYDTEPPGSDNAGTSSQPSPRSPSTPPAPPSTTTSSLPSPPPPT